ncbi:thioredoxin domain-containing protein [Diabrotica virgifera virgifera]|uniref:Thioredoxin domain-containing protein-like n=1 Tax=Diabrotica virgifera virgifera TaxID=50390 RepID=A0A6P7GC75_DIAVI|nr:thioredoxin domain-containing protein [Diabrotica virgifera virgifera]
MKKIVICTILFYLFSIAQSNLEVVQDEELMNLIRTEKHVIVLFSRKYCESCDNYENELTGLREDIVETLNAWVVKVEDSQLTRLYSPDKEPVLVFFRHGIPLLYDGPLNDELILHTFTTNKEPISKELTDNTFEHLTQAATGATTGDWFVMFYTSECIECTRLQARWEAVGAHIRSRINIARINKGGDGAITGRRFEVTNVPSFILFRQGKLYRYHLQKYDVQSLVDFAQSWHKNVTPEKVPVPKSPFDDFVAMVVEYMRENPWLWQLGGGTFVLGLLGSLFVRFFLKSAPAKKKSDKKSKEKSKNK